MEWDLATWLIIGLWMMIAIIVCIFAYFCNPSNNYDPSTMFDDWDDNDHNEIEWDEDNWP